MSRRVRALALIVGLGCGLATTACGRGPSAAPTTTVARRPRVVATTTILGALVRDVAGDGVDLDVLPPLDADPATWPGDASVPDRLAGADLVVAVGLGYDAALRMPGALPASGGPVLLEVADQLAPVAYGVGPAYPLPPPPAGAGAPAVGAPDPAVWLDPDRLTAAGATIDAAISDVATRHGLAVDDHAARLAAVAETLRVADEDAQAALGPLPADARAVVTDDPRLGYLAERYGLTLRAPAADRAALQVVVYTFALGPAGSGADTVAGLLVTDARALGAALGGALQTTR